ncbi:MAG: heparinase [Candidatus Hydrogenedentota bacterium]
MRMLLAALLLVGTSTAETDGDYVLERLRDSHPRLQLTSERLTELKSMAETDLVLQRYVHDSIALADECLGLAPLEHKLVGPRLLGVSRDCLKRVYALALAWRWTGDEKYAKAAESTLLTVSAFPDWNPSHFLDVAEMTNAAATGYDWLFDWLSEDSKAAIKTAIIEKGLKPGISIYEKQNWWTKSEFNWNNVCNGGLIVGALAIAETDPEYARYIIPKAVASLPIALASYDPDGAWMEGPSYWNYATRYTAYGLNAMQTALGSDFGLSDRGGLRATGLFPNYTAGPTGLYLNYADSGERSRRKPMACMFWLAGHFQNPAISNAEHAVLKEDTAAPEHVVWYVPPTDGEVERPLDTHFRSPVDVIVMRSAWDDPNAIFVGVKGGYNQVNHGHLDLGNFELDALGVRWARDLGSDDYNLPGYWDKKAGGERWKYYRLNSQSHNVVTIDGEDQDANATAKVVSFSAQPDEASAVLDLSEAYRAHAKSVTREIRLTENRRAVVVNDRFEIETPCDIVWGMTTDAEITVNGTEAMLSLDGKRLRARIVSPEGPAFSVESAERPAPERANAGVRRLVIRTAGLSGAAVEVTVRFDPVLP